MAIIKRTIFREGPSSTGSTHGLLIETTIDTNGDGPPRETGVRFVVTGTSGKRHAAVTLSFEDAADISRWVGEVVEGKK